MLFRDMAINYEILIDKKIIYNMVVHNLQQVGLLVIECLLVLTVMNGICIYISYSKYAQLERKISNTDFKHKRQ